MDKFLKTIISIHLFLLALSPLGWYVEQKEKASHSLDADCAQSDSCNTPYILKIKSLPLDRRWSNAQLDTLDQLALQLDEDLCNESLFMRARALIRNVHEPSPALCWGFYTHYMNKRLQHCDNQMYGQMLNAYENWRTSAKICYPLNVTTKEKAKRYDNMINLLLFETFCGLLDGQSGFSNMLDISSDTEEFREESKNVSVEDFSMYNMEFEEKAWERLVNMVRAFRDLQLS